MCYTFICKKIHAKGEMNHESTYGRRKRHREDPQPAGPGGYGPPQGTADLFKYGKSKYTDEELKEILKDENRPILAAVDDNDCLQGYAFCIFQQYKDNNIMTDIKTLYIDDLCVEETRRGEHIGKTLYNAALDFAREHGCYNVTLNVWSCNESAMKFYRFLRPEGAEGRNGSHLIGSFCRTHSPSVTGPPPLPWG